MILAIVLFFVFNRKTKNIYPIKAASDQAQITTQTDWGLGSSANIKFDDPSGSMKLNDASVGGLVATGAGDDSYNGTYLEDGAYDGNLTYTNGNRWLWFGPDPNMVWNISEAVTVKGLLCGDNHDCGYFNLDMINGPLGTYQTAPPPYDDQAPGPTIFGAGIATHTTGATQIDGGENFWSWEGFTPTDSEPANTSIDYRYRTSTDGSDWTAWTADFGSVTSRTGDDSDDPTLYRYLQVEATLANTDGVSTPTIDAYDIDYHTEVKPNKPSAQTAVAQ